MEQKRVKYKILIGVLLLLFAAASASLIYLYTTPIDLSRYSNKVTAAIEAKTGVRASIGKIVLRALPSVEVTFEDIDLYEDSETFLIVPEVTATFSLLRLLGGHYEPRLLDIVEPDILVKRFSDGSPNLGARLIAGIHPTGTLKRLRLHNGRSTIVDETIKGGKEKFALTDLEITFDKGSGTKFSASLNANLDSTPVKILSTGQYKDGRLRFKGPATLGAFDLARFAPYIKEHAPGADLKGTASAELNFFFNNGLTVKGALQYAGLSVKAPKLFKNRIDSDNGTAKLKVTVDDTEVRAGLDGIKFKIAGFDISGGFELHKRHGAAANERTLKLKLASTPIKLKRFIELLPPNLITGSLSRKMGELQPLGGTVTVEELSVDGRMDSLSNLGALAKEGKVGLRLRLDNIKFTGKVLKETFSGIKGVVSLHRDKVTLKEFSGNYGHGVLKELNAEVTGLSTNQRYSLSVKAFFEAGKTLEILKAILTSQGSKKALQLADIEASGITELDLNLKGGMKELALTDYSGTVRLKNGSFSHKAFLLKLSALNGQISFDKKKLSFKELKGEAWESRIMVNGTVAQYLTNPRYDITATGALASKTVAALSGQESLRNLHFGSEVPFSLKIEGNRELLSATADADFTGIDLKYAATIDKRAGFPLALTLNLVKVADGDQAEIRIKEFQINTGRSRAGITGVYSMETGAYTLTAATNRLLISDIASITPAIDSSQKAEGFLGLNFKIARDSTGAKPIFNGIANIKNAVFTSAYLPSPVEHLDMTARYTPKGRQLNIKRLMTGRTDLKGKIELTPLTEGTGKTDTKLWDMTFDLDAQGLFLSDFTGKKEDSVTNIDNTGNGITEQVKTEAFSLKKISSGNGKLHISKGSINKFGFEDFKADISIDPQRIYSKKIQFKKNRGSVASSVTYFRRDDAELIFDSTTVINSVDLKQFIDELGAKKTIIEGEVSIELNLNCKRGLKPATAGLTGTASMKVGQGKLWKFIMMSKILSIINIFSIDELLQQGMPYKRITGDFDIKEGVVRSNNIYLESDTLRMTAMGEISVPDQYIDSVLMLHPFVTIDKIITKIPFAGWIIGGKEKATTSLYYEIVGPLKKPYIDPVPEKSISTGVRSMLGRLEKQLEGTNNKK